MKFGPDQAVRIECCSCPDVYIGAEPPAGGWTDVRPSDDRFYNFRASCPRCSNQASGQDQQPGSVRPPAPDVGIHVEPVPLWSPQGVYVAPEDRRCGDCTYLGELGVDSLPDYGKCHNPAVLRLVNAKGMIYHIRHRPDEGRGCEGFRQR